MKKYSVGGSVRDFLLGKPSNDCDFVVTGSTPEEMLKLGFKRVGDSFPVFLHPVTGDEYALARTERKNGKGHTGFDATFDVGVTIDSDLSRRDLTINAIAFDLDKCEFIDPFNGISDVKNGILRHVSDAFSEDPLRVVRLARFYSRFSDFQIADETIILARKIVNSGEMDSISNERYFGEFEKVFSHNGDILKFFDALWMFGVFNKVKFFKDVFGTVNVDDLAIKYPDLLAKILSAPPSSKVDMFISLVASDDAQQRDISFRPRISRLTNNLRAVRKLNFEAENIEKFISSNRGWEKIPSKSMIDVIEAMFVAESVGEKFSVGPKFIAVASDRGSQINVNDFIHLSGKEIGQRLIETRIAVIRNLLKEWHENK